MTKMAPASERPLHDYLKAVSGRTGVRVGSALPLGTSRQENGGNFAFFSRHATRVRLELFDRPGDQTPARQIELDPTRNRTGDVWHVWVDGIQPGQLYAYRADGLYQPGEGQRFNFAKLLLDPYATAISRLDNWDFGTALGYDPSALDRDLTRARKWMMPRPCRNAFSPTSTLNGTRTSRPGIPGRRP
jgi:glycogen operon protein